MRFKPPAPTYIGPPAHHGPADNKPIRRIVLHETQSPNRPGAARATARYFMDTDRDASAHYVVDAGEVVQTLYDSFIGYHAPPNAHSLGVELCGVSSRTGMARWFTRDGRAMMRLARQLVAQLCLAYSVPPYFRTASGLRAGRAGVTTHAEVAKAWRQTTHWDPGAWPRRWFMVGVRREVRRIRKAAADA